MMIATGILLIALPILFNVFFAALSGVFEYPGILRQSTPEVLAKFRAGGSRLLLIWWGFAMTAVLFAPVAVLLSAQLTGADATLLAITTTVGVLAAAVQFLGLVRWPFMVPFLARESETASPARAEAIDIVFQAFNRYLGVAVGEHLGYLLTGAWSVLVGAAALSSGLLPAWISLGGIVVGTVLALCSLEFVGPFEKNGWKLAGAVVPIAYIAWSAWLAATGILIIIAVV
ncbi:MAG TPA: DUF4386 domain-containing protein [Rhodoglobus sp.]|jgi:hypothetical protein|nr:DUF4386 domain-containing protein [Rhodoglobus sp.]